MTLEESQLRKVVADFFNLHRNGKSDEFVADLTGTVSSGTVSNFVTGHTDSGFYNVYQILKGFDQSYVSLGMAIEQEEARTEGAGHSVGMVREGSGIVYGSAQGQSQPGRRTFDDQETAKKQARQIINDAGGRECAKAVLRFREKWIEHELLVNQQLHQYLDQQDH